MLTGRQIREARALLRWQRKGLVTRAAVLSSVIERSESSDGEAAITVAQEAAIRRAFQDAGVEFGLGDDGSPNVRLREVRRSTVPTGRQLRQGRELIGMSQADLAEAADVGLAVVIRAEMSAHIPQLTRRDATAIKKVLEGAGVEFFREDGGPGVRLQKVEKGSGEL